MFRGLALLLLAAWGSVALVPDAARAQQSDVDVEQNLQNPIYHQVAVPLQNNYDCCFRPEGGYQYKLNVEPVVPLFRFDRIEVVSRTIFPVIYDFNTTAGQGAHLGIGDTTQAFYISPIAGPGFYYGGGPIFLIPSEDPQLSSGQWGMGPTFDVGWKQGPITANFLYWHYWSIAGEKGAAPVSSTRLQPAFAYTFSNSTTLKLGSEADFNWIKHSWSAPFYLQVSRLFDLPNRQRVQLALAGKVFTPTTNGPEDGIRFTVTWVLPR